jgi:hypothetical protein
MPKCEAGAGLAWASFASLHTREVRPPARDYLPDPGFLDELTKIPEASGDEEEAAVTELPA